MVSQSNFSGRRLAVILMDMVAIVLAFLLAFWLRFDCTIDAQNLGIILRTVPFAVLAYFMTANIFSLYRGIYHFSSFSDLINISKAVGSGALISTAIIMFQRQGQFPRSVLILHPLLTFLGICAVRFSIRSVKQFLRRGGINVGDGRAVLLVGAGELGESILRQILKTPEAGLAVVGFIDDDANKWGMRIHGYTVLGGRAALADIVKKHDVEEIIIAISSQRGEIVRSVVETLRTLEKRPELKIAPAFDEMLKAPHEGLSLRRVKPADLLNRTVVKLDETRIARVVERKVVLVTGAGGTIGAELCRQALKYGPEKIVLIENHATSLFFQNADLREASKGTAIVPILGDIRDQGLLDRVFKEHKPSVVLHAAAHKHVHQLEFNVLEGISNNVLGTYNLASAAHRHGIETFLLISTDKAVKPSSVMGATKRAAEVIIQSFSQMSKTTFVGVRFGNVLGSSGSVLRIFHDQIQKGGPITVTDERVTRYFMTVEEAVGLILQAASMAKGGEIYVLKMGTPVRIIDMAKNLLTLHGLEPGKDIEIRITGLRQGEKLDEELVEDPAGLAASEHPDVMLLGSENTPDPDIEKRILELELISRGSDPKAALRHLQQMVPTFQPAAAHGS